MHAPALARPPRRRTFARPRLSVVIVNYLHWDETARLVAQLRASPAIGRNEAEIVIVDNHSPKHPVISRLRRMSGVSLRRWHGNRGFARAANEGSRLSQGDWVLLLNPDTSVRTEFLERVLGRIDSFTPDHSDIGIIGFGLRHSDGSKQLSTGKFQGLFGTLLRLILPRALRKYTAPDMPDLCPVDWVTGCGLLVRRECWDDLGGLDPNFFLYYEDMDLCRRAWQAGWKVMHDPTTQITHHHPLHTRQVPAHLRLITRHALLTYAARHWPRDQQWLLSRVVQAESYARQLAAWCRGHFQEAAIFAHLRDVTRQLEQGNHEAALKILRRVVRDQEAWRATEPDHHHSQPQPGGPAAVVPAKRRPACARGDTDPCRR